MKKKTYKDKIPEPGERFSYVIPKTDIDFDLSGKMLNLTKGDRIEFVDVAKELGKEIDLSYYLQNKIIGLCARFINYDDRYQPSPSDKIRQLKDSDEKYKQIDEYSQKKAKKWLEEYVDSLSGISPKMMLNRGYAYKRAAIKTAQSILHQKIGNTYEIFHGEWFSFEDVQMYIRHLQTDSILRQLILSRDYGKGS